MTLAEKLNLDAKDGFAIDWDLTPADTFGTFESWGGRERVRNNNERFYYFYIDNWDSPARLCLMERGVKFAKVLARVEAPQQMIDFCVAAQGKGLLDKSYAIDENIRQWLINNILEAEDLSRVIPLEEREEPESLATGLPGRDAVRRDIEPRVLRGAPATLSVQEVADCIRQHDFFDSRVNPEGRFHNALVDNGDALTVTDLATGVIWQRAGCDITNIRRVMAYVEELNRRKFAGFSDWRLPTMEEAASLLGPEKNEKGLRLHACFSREQPFIFLADQRRPGGYWFADFKQATIFWASGTIPGGFGRVCRSA